MVKRQSKEKCKVKKYKNYSDLQLKLAVNSVKRGQKSLRDAAKIFNIPICTLMRRVNDVNSGENKESVLDSTEEQFLKDNILKFGKLGYGCNTKTLIKSALEIIRSRADPAKRNIRSLTTGWARSFFKRHSDISKQSLQLSKAAAPAKMTDLLEDFYKIRENPFKEEPLDIKIEEISDMEKEPCVQKEKIISKLIGRPPKRSTFSKSAVLIRCIKTLFFEIHFLPS